MSSFPLATARNSGVLSALSPIPKLNYLALNEKRHTVKWKTKICYLIINVQKGQNIYVKKP